MSEPEDVVIDAAHVVSERTLDLWDRHSADREPEMLRLEAVERRLSLFLNATFRLDVPIVVAEPPMPPNFLVRWFREIPKFNVREEPIPSTDGARIRLPRRLPYPEGERERAVERYRVYAVEQAIRLMRGTAHHVPEDDRHPTRPLYLLAEGASADRYITNRLQGLVEAVRRERQRALMGRPELEQMSDPEGTVEGWVQDLLEAPPGEPPDHIPTTPDPAASREWAEAKAGRIRATEKFRGIPLVDLWGDIEGESAPGSEARGGGERGGDDDEETRSRQVERRPRAREAEDDEDDDGEGSWFVPSDDLHETAQDPMGLQRPVDRDDQADPDELAESLSEMEQGRLVRTDDAAREVLTSGDPPPRGIEEVDYGDVDGITYPEWNWRSGEYRPEAAIVRPREPELGEGSWADETRRDNSALIHEVRRCFEQLRPRRQVVDRQPDGEQIDIGAYVESHADRQAGCMPEHRLYKKRRPKRREVAVQLLIDVSASTDSWLIDNRRIIDAEKEALLIVCEALEALGDDYAIRAFSGRGPQHVRSWPVKEFDETYRREVERRIAGLKPDRYTRSGAALRHATAALLERKVRHPLLLFLSDGKPNDVDRYENRYGIEDTRQAVREARMQGVEVFCLTIDRDAPTYMDGVFGPSGYAVLRQPEILPRVLVTVVRKLLDK